MQFYYDSSGKLIKSIPEEVYQGSANANTIYFIGAFPENCVVAIAYIYPNGVVSEQQLLARVTDLSEIQTESGQTFNVWKCTIDAVVTEYYGTATIQFFVYDGRDTATKKEKAIATQACNFDILKGVPYIIPDDFATGSDLLTQILSVLPTVGEISEYRDEAVNSAQSASESATQAEQSATSALNSSNTALQAETNAKNSEEIAVASATQAQESALIAQESAQSATKSAEIAQEVSVKNTKDINNIYTLLGATVTDEYPLSQAYSTRETADGNTDIIDGALTRVTKIQGATVATTNLFNPNRTFQSFGAHDPATKRSFSESALYKGVTANNYAYAPNITNATYENGTFTFSTKQSMYGIAIPFRVLPSKQYTVSLDILSGEKLAIQVSQYTKDGTLISYDNSGLMNETYAFTTKNNCEWINVIVCIRDYVADQPEITISYKNVQLVEGTAKPYRPYFSGLRNSYFKGIRSTGKNLFNPNRTLQSFGAFENTTVRSFNESALYKGASYNNYSNPNGLSNVSYTEGTFTFTTKLEMYGIAIPFKVTPNTTYRVSYNLLSGANIIANAGYYDENGVQISYKGWTKLFTTPSNCAWMNIIICCDTARDTAQTISYNNFQLEYGDTATEYEPYTADESFMLDKAVELGAWDYIDTERKKVVRATRVLTFKGSTNFVQTNANTEKGLYDYKYTYGQTQYLGKGYSSVVKSRPTDFTVGQSGGTTSLSIMVFNNTPYATAEEFNAHLAENPLQVAYQLFNSVEEAIAIPTDKYQSWVHGSETRVQGDTEDTDNSADGAVNTVTQEYYTQKGA